MAPHGGGIEAGTARIASAIAGNDHAFYAFKGIRPQNNFQLHIASHCFDEPRAINLASSSHTIITIHGCKDKIPLVYIGGRDQRLREKIILYLKKIGVITKDPPSPSLGGMHDLNLCNRGLRGKGVQIEISASLRKQLIGAGGWKRARNTSQMETFAKAIRQTLTAHRL